MIKSQHRLPRLLEVRDHALAETDVGPSAVASVARFRRRCMEEDVSQAQAHSRHYEVSAIAEDEWDWSAIHVAVSIGGEIAGVARINYTADGALPFSSHVRLGRSEVAPLNGADLEISRLFVLPRYRRTHVAITLLYFAAELIASGSRLRRGRIFADLLLDQSELLNKLTYAKVGFRETALEYFDPRYSAQSRIYWLDMDRDLERYRYRAGRNYGRSVRMRDRMSCRPVP